MQTNYKISSNDEILEALHPVPDFENRDDIKPWIHERLDPRGISLVIERSDASKVVFKCKNLHRKSSTPRASTTKLVNGKPVTKRVRTSPEDSCSFRLRVSYSVKHKAWAVNIIKPEHNMALCSNFGDGCGMSASSTPNSISSTKRSWTSTYTPASTTSPVMSITNSPASTFTPASEAMEFDFDIRSKRTRLSYESPLSHEIDPLEKLSLPEDLSDLNHLVSNNNLQITNPVTTFDNSLDYTDFNEDFLNTDKMFALDFDPSTNMTNSNSNSTSNMPSTTAFPFSSNTSSSSNDMFTTNIHGMSNMVTTSKTDMSLNIASQSIKEEDEEDPLVYLLGNTNSRYSIEELENLDKAMGIDVNDQFLMSMFNKM